MNTFADPGNGGVDGETASPSKRKRRGGDLNPDATLESNLDALNVKKFDLAFAVDPLFHKTSAQFDEGGAGGLLLNTLSVYHGCEIVFDSMDVPEAAINHSNEERERIDSSISSRIRMDSIKPDIAVLGKMSGNERISPAIDDIFRLLGSTPSQNDAHEAEQFVKRVVEMAPDSLPTAAQSCANSPTADGRNSEAQRVALNDFHLANSETFDFGDDIGADSYDLDEYNGEQPNQAGTADAFGVMGSEHPYQKDGSYLEDDALNWLMNAGYASKQSYVTASKGWAGASHWKYRAVPTDSVEKSHKAGDEDGDGSKKRSKSRRNKDPLNFVALMGEGAEEPQFEFLPRTNVSCRTESSRRTNRAAAKTLLPEDYHYSPESLARYALRPRSIVKLPGIRRKADGSANDEVNYAGGEFDDLVDNMGAMNMHDEDDHDAYGGGVGDDWGSAFESLNQNGGNEENLELVDAARQVERVDINYCKAAKQVDVKSLKELMWSGMQAVLKETGQGRKEVMDLSEILEHVPVENEAGRLEDLSVHLCFICVLHLANEHGLVVKGVPELNKMLISNIPEL